MICACNKHVNLLKAKKKKLNIEYSEQGIVLSEGIFHWQMEVNMQNCSS